MGLPDGEQPAGERLDAHRGGAFAHADEDHARRDEVDVAALQGGWRVVGVVVAVVDREAGVAEQRVVAVHGAGVDGLTAAGRLGHRVDGEAAADPGRVVTLEERVGQRGEHEVVDVEGAPGQAGPGQRGQIGLRDPADEVLGQRGRSGVVEQGADLAGEADADAFGGEGAVEGEGFGSKDTVARRFVTPIARLVRALPRHSGTPVTVRCHSLGTASALGLPSVREHRDAEAEEASCPN